MPLVDTVKGAIWYEDNRNPVAHLPVTLMVHGAGGSHLDWPAELRRLPEANAVTDTNGYFILRDTPAPGFFVHIDGSSATNAPGTGEAPLLTRPMIRWG